MRVILQIPSEVGVWGVAYKLHGLKRMLLAIKYEFLIKVCLLFLCLNCSMAVFMLAVPLSL